MNRKRIGLLIPVSIASQILVMLLLILLVVFIRYDFSSVIPDRKLQSIVREIIDKPHGKILPEDCKGIKKLQIGFTYSIHSLKGLRYFEDLQILECYQTSIRDISELSGLKNLKELDLRETRVRDLTPLAGLPELQKINLYRVRAKDLSPLAQCPKLEVIYIDDFFYHDFSSLKKEILISRDSNEPGG